MTNATKSPVTQVDTIRVGHPLREDFSGCSTGNGGPYYPTKGDAVRAYSAALAEYELQFDPDSMIDMPGDNGCIPVDVYTDELECSRCVGRAIISWYRMDQTGRYEFTGYLA